jgi:glycerol-3-phosphate acyltransferase PlsY
MSDPLLYATALLAYLLGSIPFGLLLTRLAGLGDVRAIGSGNIGATNVLRTGNIGLALVTLVFDIGKGAVAVLIARRFGPHAADVAAISAVLGHMFPLWLKFKGGKGVATAAGVFLAYAWPMGLAAVLTWIVAAVIWRYSSLAALIAAVSAPVYAWLFGLRDAEPMMVVLAIALLVILRHRANIQRLLNGTETKISFGKKSA